MLRDRIVPLAATAALGLLALPASAAEEGFELFPAGQVVAGQLPGGGTAADGLFGDFNLVVSNLGGGPSSAVVFDSSAPTGGDLDLGTPNESAGGPGVGAGGESGPGANREALGKILVIAEDIVDAGGDGLVDDPDDENGGGYVEFHFHEPVVVFDLILVDIDADEGATIELSEDDLDRGTVEASRYGNNSVEHVDLSQNGPVTRLVVRIASSGAIGGLEYFPASVPTESNSFGKLKASF